LFLTVVKHLLDARTKKIFSVSLAQPAFPALSRRPGTGGGTVSERVQKRVHQVSRKG
jgi:hypothetical protein